MAGTLTDGNKQSLVGNTTDLVLQTVDDNRRQHGLARTRLTSEGQRGALTLQEPGQVWSHPQAGQFLALMSEVGGVLRKVTEDAVFWSEPGTNRLDERHYAGNASQ